MCDITMQVLSFDLYWNKICQTARYIKLIVYKFSLYTCLSIYNQTSIQIGFVFSLLTTIQKTSSKVDACPVPIAGKTVLRLRDTILMTGKGAINNEETLLWASSLLSDPKLSSGSQREKDKNGSAAQNGPVWHLTIPTGLKPDSGHQGMTRLKNQRFSWPPPAFAVTSPRFSVLMPKGLERARHFL